MSSSAHSPSLVGSDREIDARSIVTLLVFFLVNVLVIFPFHIPLPSFVIRGLRTLLVSTRLRKATTEDKEEPPWSFPLGLETAPVIGVIVLLASTSIPGSVIRDGIVGSGGVRPYDIMTLFISFAYISLSLDCTGLLRYLAFLVASRASSSGNLLYLAFYTFFALSGLLVGNDPLILSGTPFLVYFTRHASIDPPTAYLFTHFQVSNLVSALLVSSNPTNLVLTSAFGISFLSYSAWLALPTVAGVVVLFPVLRYLVFRKERMIPSSLNPPKIDARTALVDPWGAAFGGGLFVITIVTLVGLSAGGLLEGVEGVWTVTAPAGLVMLVRDCVHDILVRKRDEQERRGKEELVRAKGGEGKAVGPLHQAVDGEKGSVAGKIAETHAEELSNGGPRTMISGFQVAQAGRDQEIKENEKELDHRDTPEGRSRREPTLQDSSPTTRANEPDTSDVPSQAIGEASSHEKPTAKKSPPPNAWPGPRFLQSLAKTFPTPSLIFTRLPLPLVPFAFSMFILVESLQYTGWIRVFGVWWAAWARVGGVAGSVWLMGTIGVLGCNVLGTNIGATVLLSRVLQEWQATTQNISDRTLHGTIFALAIGSNFGAYSFVFPASLAGLLWRDILGQKGLSVGAREFVRWNTVPMMVTTVISCLVVAAEVCIMYKT